MRGDGWECGGFVCVGISIGGEEAFGLAQHNRVMCPHECIIGCLKQLGGGGAMHPLHPGLLMMPCRRNDSIVSAVARPSGPRASGLRQSWQALLTGCTSHVTHMRHARIVCCQKNGAGGLHPWTARAKLQLSQRDNTTSPYSSMQAPYITRCFPVESIAPPPGSFQLALCMQAYADFFSLVLVKHAGRTLGQEHGPRAWPAAQPAIMAHENSG